MSAESRASRRKEVKRLFGRAEFSTVRVVGYVASCVSHDPIGRGKVEAWATEDQFMPPRACRTEEEYDDVMAYATRQAQKAHAKTKCAHDLVVVLNVS